MAELTLFNNRYSVCSMKARLALEEKGATWQSYEIDIVKALDQFLPWYIEMNERAVVPTLKADDKVITNSAQIIRFVADLPAGPRLMPATERDRQLVNDWIDRADSVNLQTLSYANHPSFEQSEAILNARIARAFEYSLKYPALAERYLGAARRVLGYKQRESKEEVAKIEALALRNVDDLEQRLAKFDYIAGDSYSLADVIWTVLLARFDLLQKPQLIGEEAHPRVAEYYERVKARPSFASANVQNTWWFTQK